MSTMKIRSMISQILTYLNAYFYERIVGSSNEIIWIGNNVQKWDINLIFRDLTQVIKGPSSQVIKPIFHQTSKLDYQNINNKKCNWKCLWRARVITEAIVKIKARSLACHLELSWCLQQRYEHLLLQKRSILMIGSSNGLGVGCELAISLQFQNA